jgi:hypothetical protein
VILESTKIPLEYYRCVKKVMIRKIMPQQDQGRGDFRDSPGAFDLIELPKL